MSRLHVTGDAYRAVFYLPAGTTFLPEWERTKHSHAHALPVGVEYIFRAIRAACSPQSLLLPCDRYLDVDGFTRSASTVDVAQSVVALYEIGNVGSTPALDTNKPLPILRVVSADTQGLVLSGLRTDDALVCGSTSLPEESVDVFVQWFGELAPERPPNPVSRECRIHIQVGLPEPLETPTSDGQSSALKFTANLARIVVVNVGEIDTSHRIRRSLSYEAVAVDLLRFLRGDNAIARPNTSILQKLWKPDEGVAPTYVLAVRLNNSAVFLYACRGSLESGKTSEFNEIGSWLMCHRLECAPLSQPELGRMVGYTGFVSAQVSAAMIAYLETIPQSSPADKGTAGLLEAVCEGVRRSLMWQRISFEQGCLHMLLEKNKNSWVATSADVRKPRMGYENMFANIVKTLNARCPTACAAPTDPLKARLSQYDDYAREEVLTIPVQIGRAVAHRTQWFMGRSLAAKTDKCGDFGGERDIDDKQLKAEFQNKALSWLCAFDPRQRLASIPIVTIGDAELTDRREIEDYLAIHQALSVYALSFESKPLNIAVFGAPGAGKSFAVQQVVKHIGETTKGRFRTDLLSFNLGQFKSLDDLPAALHLVRNECLSPEIPIVFFDEFDSAFNGQPFGWLKFFLAPMQDGEFYHAGQTYKMGRAVFVFAGGVNRSFEELNGRVRNPGFCEAKGPDFISRLKVHLNVQGINRPEEEADQLRYILRRGILLRAIVRKKLGLKKDQEERDLLHPSVAKALLGVDRFKHGVRSLDAIIKMCTARQGHPIGPSDLPSMDQLEMHVDASKLLRLVDKPESFGDSVQA